MRKFIFLVLGAVIIVLLSSAFMVHEGRRGIVIQFGEIVSKEALSPGLHFKIPFVQKVVGVDSRILDLSSDSREVIAHDQKRLIVSYYAKYKIVDPIQFYRSARSIANLESRLKPVIESNMREQIGLVPLVSILTEERAKVMHNIRMQSAKAAKEFGVEVVDVRIKRTDLPEENSDAIFKRMQTEREKEAKEIRAQGYQESQTVISAADREKKSILSESYNKAELIKGEGDAQAAAIYAKAYSLDKDFYEFYRTIIAYERSFSSHNTKFIINSDDRFLDILKRE